MHLLNIVYRSVLPVVIMLSSTRKFACNAFTRRLVFPTMRNTLRPLSTTQGYEGNNLFSQSVAFEEIGVSKPLVIALASQDLKLTTPIQRMAYSTIYSGMDTLIGAETGSGKTLAYLLPLMDAYLALGDIDIPNYPCGIILAPTKELCWQIEDMAQATVKGLNDQGLRFRLEAVTEATGRWKYAPDDVPTFLVCTPKYLANFIQGPIIHEEALFESIRYLVLDEADMLLDGSYVKDVEKILDALKVVRRGLIREGLVKVHEQVTQFVLSAATIPSFGLKSVKAYIQKRFPRAKIVWTENMHAHHPAIAQEYIMIEPTNAGEVLFMPGSDEHVTCVVRALLSAATASNAEEPHAALPGSASVSTLAPSPSSAQVAELSPEEVARANALCQLTMIFLNTADAAQRFAEVLRGAGVQCVQFHKLCPSAEREASLRRFREGSVKIFVCTDSAARGLDLPQVRHVVQAEFALNVVQHQHRVGRASRAGRIGRATNFVFPSSRALVDLILRSDQQQQQQHMEELAKAVKVWQGEKDVEEFSSYGDEAPSPSPSSSASGVHEEEGEGEDDEVDTQQRQLLQKAGDEKCNAAASREERHQHPQPFSPVAGITQAFSRRRGFRRNLRRQKKNVHDPTEDVTQPSP